MVGGWGGWGWGGEGGGGYGVVRGGFCGGVCGEDGDEWLESSAAVP